MIQLKTNMKTGHFVDAVLLLKWKLCHKMILIFLAIKIIKKMISNQNRNHLLENDLKSKSRFKNLISNRDFKSFDFKSFPTLHHALLTTTRQTYKTL